MLEWVALGAAAGGGFVYSLVRSSRARARWRTVMQEVVKSIPGARGSADTELRAEIDGLTVTLKLLDVAKADEDGRAEASAQLPEAAQSVRFYFGWDVLKESPGLEHVPEVPYVGTTRLMGDVRMRADDPETAGRFIRAAIHELTDLRSAADAHGLEVVARGGYLTVTVYGLQETVHMLSRMVLLVAELAQLLTRGDDESPPAEVVGEETCALCAGRRKTNETWIQCHRCSTPYHQSCWAQATGCTNEGCIETRSCKLEARSERSERRRVGSGSAGPGTRGLEP